MAKKKKLSKKEIKAILSHHQALKDERTKAEKFLDSLEDAPIATMKKAVIQKGMFVRVKAGFCDDSFEAKQMNKKAYRITNSVRGAGGYSY